jgi:hypothetical protein
LLSSLVVGDFNGDQRLDMAVINDNGLTVLLNQGNGAFLAVPVLGLTDVGEGPASLVAGDFNGDGTLDLAWRRRPPTVRGAAALLYCWAWATVIFSKPFILISMEFRRLWWRETSTATARLT